MVTENEGHQFLLKIESVGLKLHQNTLKNSVWFDIQYVCYYVSMKYLLL